MFDKVNEFIRDYDRTKYFVLFGLKKHDASRYCICFFLQLC